MSKLKRPLIDYESKIIEDHKKIRAFENWIKNVYIKIRKERFDKGPDGTTCRIFGNAINIQVTIKYSPMEVGLLTLVMSEGLFEKAEKIIIAKAIADFEKALTDLLPDIKIELFKIHPVPNLNKTSHFIVLSEDLEAAIQKGEAKLPEMEYGNTNS